MKKIFLICSNYIENLDVFVPSERNDTSQFNISVLLLHKKPNIEKIHFPHVWNLSETDTISTNISYQDFLEQIFLHDLAVVI